MLAPAQASPDSGIAPPAPIYLVTPEFVEDVAKTLGKGIETYQVTDKTRRVKILCGDANLAREIGESFAAPPGCIETLGKACGELARKYPAILQWGAEGTIIACVGTWFAKAGSANKKLLELENLVREQAKARATASSVAPKAA